MKATLGCRFCNNSFRLKDYNPMRMVVNCGICGTVLSIAESVTYTYGRTAGKAVAQILSVLSRIGSKKNADCREAIERASRGIERAIAQYGEVQGEK